MLLSAAQTLPPGVLARVLDHLAADDVRALAATCRACRAAASSTALASTTVFSASPAASASSLKLAKPLPPARDKPLPRAPHHPSRVALAARRYAALSAGALERTLGAAQVGHARAARVLGAGVGAAQVARADGKRRRAAALAAVREVRAGEEDVRARVEKAVRERAGKRAGKTVALLLVPSAVALPLVGTQVRAVRRARPAPTPPIATEEVVPPVSGEDIASVAPPPPVLAETIAPAVTSPPPVRNALRKPRREVPSEVPQAPRTLQKPRRTQPRLNSVPAAYRPEPFPLESLRHERSATAP